MFSKVKNKYKDLKIKKAREREEKNADYSYDASFEEALVTWDSVEANSFKRGLIWKIVMSVLILGLATLGVYMQAYTFTLAVVAFAVTYIIIHAGEKRSYRIKISAAGIKIGARKIPYENIKDFWIISSPPFTPTFHIRLDEGLFPEITIPIFHISTTQIREALKGKIPELEGKKESFSSLLSKTFRI